LYDNAGKLYHKIESSFNLSTAFAIEEEKEKFHFGASGQAEYRNEKIDTTSTTYSRLDIRTTGTYSWLNLGTYFHLDNQEVGGRQPQNRYLLTAETGWLRLQYGDAYPYYPTLIASGKRIRGITGNLSLGGYLNVDASYGETERKIEGYVLYQQEYDTSTHSSRPTNSLLVRDSADVKWWYDIFQRGTYTRKFLAVRPSFGSGETFQWGLTYMKAIDDTGSIKYGITPAENLVVGTDLLFNFFDDKFRWESQAAVSVNNTDIQGGSWTQADYDSMKANDPKTGKDLEDLGKLADKFITINENVFPSNPVGPGMPSIAFESILSLNVLNNFVRATYFRRGAAYKSFGNEFLQTDIQGYSVSDRIRMLSNKVFLSVSWEDKKDNTANTKTATTRYTNLNTSLNLNIAAGYPSFVFGYGLIGRLSDKLVTKKEIVGIQNYKATGIGDDSTSTGYTADDKSTRLFIATNYDFKLGARHSFTFSYSGLDRKDNSLYKRDQQNSNIQGSLTTYFDFPLQTFFSALISNSRSYRNDIKTNGADSTYFSEFKYTALSLGAQYRMMNDDLRVTFAVAPIFGDFRRTALQTGADYTVAVGHNIEFRLDIVQNTAKTSTGTERSYTDVITSLVYRFDF
jgi:hypothetical protein